MVKASVGPQGEQNLRKAFADGSAELQSVELVNRLTDVGYSRDNAYNLVSRANKVGLLTRRLAEVGRWTYALNCKYSRDGGPVVFEAPVQIGVAYVGPAFDREPLLPHLGTPCGDDDELPPAVGERYRDTTRRIFERAFTAVE